MAAIHRKLGGLFAVAIMALAAAGCSSDSDEPDASAASVAPSSSATEETAEATSTAASTDVTSATSASEESTADPGSNEPIKVLYIPKDTSNAYFNPIKEGFAEAAAELNMTVEVVGPATAEADSQIPFIDAAIQQEVDAIAISPNDASLVVPSLQRAMEAGIKVISVNSDMDVEGRDVAILPVDFDNMGEFLLELTGAVTGGEGKFAILSATADAPDQNAWIEAIEAGLEAGEAPGLELVTTVYGDDDDTKSASETEALLTSQTDLAAILAPTAAGLPAAARVLSTSSEKGKVQLTGLALPNSMKPYVEDGTVQQFGLWDPKTEGIVAAHLIAGLVNGSITIEPGATFDVPGVGSKEVSDKTQIIAGELLVFDASNIDQFDF